MLLRAFIIICLLFVSVDHVFAQSDAKQYSFRRIDVAKGLSHNQVTCIFKDSKGFMWYGTMSGLDRYDGYNFKVYKHAAKDSTSIDDDYILRIMEMPDNKLLIQTRNWFNVYDPIKDKFNRNFDQYLSSIHLPANSEILKTAKANDNSFYILTSRQGLYKYDFKNQKCNLIISAKDADRINSIDVDNSGNIWLIRVNGEIQKLDGKSNQITYSTELLANFTHRATFYYNIFIDNQNELWLYIPGVDQRSLFHFNPLTEQLEPIGKNEGPYGLNSNLIMGVLQDNDSRIWICTDHGGINVLDKQHHSIRYLVNNPDDNTSLSQNSITAFYKDNTGIIWIGTYKRGVSCFGENIIKFPLYRHQPSNPHSLSYDDVNKFAEDAKGNLWIGTNGGGLIYFDRHNGTFKQFKHQKNNSNSICNDVIVSLFIDRQQKLWIGTYFGGLDCYDGKSFIHYKHNDRDSTSISDDRVWEIYEDSRLNLWIGTLGEGLDRLDRATNIFYHYKPNTRTPGHSNYVSELTEDGNGDLWVGTATGVDVIRGLNEVIAHYDYNQNNSGSLSNGNVSVLFRDSKNRMWVGTREGLNVFNAEKKTFQHFTTDEGLPDNAILNIFEDSKNELWISTSKGISNIIINENKDGININCRNYDESDGLQGTAFNENAGLKTREGEMVFGGANGFNIFRPERIAHSSAFPDLVFTDFQLFNKSIDAGELVNGTVLLPNSIARTHEITLHYNQNVIAIEFAALNFANTEKTKYAYKLEGFSNKWLMTDGKMRKAVFTNLDPGNYVFRVKTANDDGSWSPNDLTLKIKILPPFWKTPIAYFLYIIIGALALYFSRKMELDKRKRRFILEQERRENKQRHELDLMKIKFFTNVSHEFRTPLSLILAPVDKLLKQVPEGGQKQQLQLVHRSARKLLNLVNQLLDFRKMEERELKLHPKEGNIIDFIIDISIFFNDIAERKNISFSINTEIDALYTRFDHDKLERILFNVLSNAFKFTPENGHVGIEISMEGVPAANECKLLIAIRDTGIGVDASKHNKIFDRFFQDDIPGSMVNQGSGIGLAITKEFVKLHGGTITIESERDKGSCFIITIPLVILEVLKPQIKEIDKSNMVTDASIAEEEEVIIDDDLPVANEEKLLPSSTKKMTVLLIEDNDDFRFYLKDNLQEHFKIVEAANGKLGWQKALAAHPDLIVSDISMPEMDGTELCRKLKNDKRTTHIPIILLTALTGDDQQLKGLETGANDYMTKPFNFEILLSKIKNQLSQQEQTKKTYQKQVAVKTSDVVVEAPNEKFIQQVLELVEKNISEPDFSVEDMSKELFMSRVALYKKLLAFTGKTPIEFIRQVRIKRAAQLLEKTEMTVAEVAYDVGFNNPKYFSKYFKAEFNKLPSTYIEEMRNFKKKVDLN